MRDHRKILKTLDKIATASEDEAFSPDYEGQTRKQEIVLDLIEKDKLPAHITCWGAFKNSNLGNDKPYHGYWLSVGIGELTKVLFKSEDEIREHLQDVKDTEMPNLPSDGSKGQWRIAHQQKIKFLEWLLEDDGE